MSELVALFRRDGAPLQEAELAGARSALRRTSRIDPEVVISATSFVVLITNDEPSTHQAFSPPAVGQCWAALDGRIDDRDEVAARIRFPSPRPGTTGDAELLQRAFEAEGEELFERWIGPFAALLFEPRQHRLTLARDPMGSRSLFLRRSGSFVAVGSRPSLLRSLGGHTAPLHEETVARFLATVGPRPGATFFAGIEELRPGEVLRLDARGIATSRSVQLAPSPAPGKGRERDYEERFRELLERAVECRLSPAGGTAILMSGGLDSTSIAATAGQLLSARDARPPVAISWVFSGLKGIDESTWIDATVDHCELESLRVQGEDLWPLGAEPDWSRRLDAPVTDPFWRLHEESLQLARAAGASALLTGGGGDQLWQGGRDWLRDLVLAGAIPAAALSVARGAVFELRNLGLEHPLWNSLGRLVRPRLSSRPLDFPDWSTPEAREHLIGNDTGAGTRTATTASIALRSSKLAQAPHLAMAAAAARDARAYGISSTRPYRDRRLAELFLAIPADLLYRPGETKRLLRRALRGRLPEFVRQRRQPTSLKALADRGLADRGRARLNAVLGHREAAWPRYIRADWLDKQSGEALARSINGIESLVLWNCYCLECWRDTLH